LHAGGHPDCERLAVPYGLYISAEGAHALNQRLEVLANNLANVDTTAFKRDLALFQARFTEADEQGLDQPGSGTFNDLSGGVRLEQTKTDFSQGPMRSTGAEFDMAIQGEGYFVVQKGEQQLLTRAGNFQLNGINQLVTADGYPVLNDAGTPIVIDSPWQLSPSGEVAQAGGLTPLAIVRPQSLGDLAKHGENLFAPLSPPIAMPPAERRVSSGYLEGSGVRPTVEMMELIETSRAFEANVNMIKHQDQAMGSLISRVLKDA
jgi:flagellar basal-body rod protein FlgF